ncbi:rna-directed dna polymerase from mobile element jockey-like [Willisornis vidua]|uniref:Rna-directed dna polymerase from mobile element jockey-like n=1 Tax=Willisornis vidua TaxID=1566151 RepID=A0ABQ9D8Z0_9PASS|nr:rna-directed dna polymerase from mobile element jockey-like [Willisornis vidua]
MSKQRAVMSVVPQGSILVPLLFKISAGDMDRGTECPLNKFANNTELCGVVNMLEGRDAIQRDPGRFESWACTNLMKLNKAKTQRMFEENLSVSGAGRFSLELESSEVNRGGYWQGRKQ